jgi:hypothetical protein
MMLTLNNYISNLKEILEKDVEKEDVNKQWIKLKNKAKIKNSKIYIIKLNNKQNQ